MTGKTNFQAVAQNCSQFDSRLSLIKSSKGDDIVTCLICNHFKEGFCNIDKYDPILSNLT
ncbi:hypothetical protein GC105_02235 [Alkalibaculum sp. M08DMB]|uniref:Uncharacterized protein n=1 Tax=Alkalibaculum sporogenes TaxID=2655001 RepID=A0A6A7K5I3_9FIRM|nr:hypothetical protein [Alkalibaculum sporogenes]MPW24611.1 hypothetical protein [Alkalibaculum sporogenes]